MWTTRVFVVARRENSFKEVVDDFVFELCDLYFYVIQIPAFIECGVKTVEQHASPATTHNLGLCVKKKNPASTLKSDGKSLNGERVTVMSHFMVDFFKSIPHLSTLRQIGMERNE